MTSQRAALSRSGPCTLNQVPSASTHGDSHSLPPPGSTPSPKSAALSPASCSAQRAPAARTSDITQVALTADPPMSASVEAARA